MRVVYGEDQAVGNWVKSRIPYMTGFGQSVAVGVATEAKLVAGIVWHNYSPTNPGGNIEVSVAADSALWLRPRILRELLNYPFKQLGCHRITAIVARKNKRSRKFTEHFGFRLEGVVRKGLGADDAMIYGMLRPECRWMKE
jgi:RimJ/RimL family protein N-acetyltransferase